MALKERHRSSIYQTLAPMLGEEEAEALLSQFPARDLDEPVTKEFVRAEIADLRTEMHDEFRRMTTWLIGTMITTMLGAAGLVIGGVTALN